MAVKGTREKSSSGWIMGIIIFSIIIVAYMVRTGTMSPMAAISGLFDAVMQYVPAQIENIIREAISFVMDIFRRILRELQQLLQQLL